MNYVWEVPIRAKHQQVDLSDVNFKLSQNFSPYLELSNEFLNKKEVQPQIEVNPYYRFFTIFRQLFSADYYKYDELRNVLFDLLIHFLAQTDSYQGMDKIEFYQKFIRRDIKNNAFGTVVKDCFEYFTLAEINILLEQIYKFYSIGKHFFFLEETVKKIFSKIIFYLKQRGDNEVILFINEAKTDKNKAKLKIIKEIFLPLDYKLEVYWQDHFGIIGVEETMQINKIAIY